MIHRSATLFTWQSEGSISSQFSFTWSRDKRQRAFSLPHSSYWSEGVPSSRSHAPVGHSFGLEMVTASTGYQRERPRSRTSSWPLLDLAAITCATPQLTRVHGRDACSHSAASISS